MNKTPMRRAREKAGLTLAQVSAGTDIPFSTVQAFEAGRGPAWSIERKMKIADFLKVPFDELWPEVQERMKQTQATLKRAYATEKRGTPGLNVKRERAKG